MIRAPLAEQREAQDDEQGGSPAQKVLPSRHFLDYTAPVTRDFPEDCDGPSITRFLYELRDCRLRKFLSIHIKKSYDNSASDPKTWRIRQENS
jgi:hypothetical protein